MASPNHLLELAALPPAPGAPAEALGVVELESIVRGHRVLDAMVKRAPVRVRAAYPVSSGKFLIFIDGQVAEVEEALDAGLARADAHLAGSLFLPRAHDQLWLGLVGQFTERAVDALGLFESRSVVDCLLGADAALKASEVELAALHLARGIGGRAYFVVSGSQPDVEAALEAVEASSIRPALVIEQDVITAPHDEMTVELLGLTTIHPKY